ncbi:MAG: hypothetical protein CMK59_14260 [Proteobacteria bacterium]|nr:hypothetical protein [Pseudomonadota bacterium]
MFYLILAACNSDNSVKDADLGSSAINSYQLQVNEPRHGGFYNDSSVPIEGFINPPGATLLIEGIPISTDDQGGFSFELPLDSDYEIIDFELVEGDLTERIPVFRGVDPVDSWPGGITARLLPLGMDVLGAQLGAALDDTGWTEQISAQLPETDWGTGGLYPVGVVQDPTVVALRPAEDGVAVAFTLNNFGIEYSLVYDLFGTTVTDVVSFTIAEIAIGATAVPYFDENGTLIFSLVEADLVMDTPDVQFGMVDGFIVEWLMQAGWDWIMEPIAENILDTVLAEVGSLELGGPFAFETDLMGSTFGLNLYDIYGDLDGLALGVEIAVGDLGYQESVDIPVPTQETTPDAQLAVALHEGLFQELLSGQLLGLLSQDLDLGGSFGAIIGNGLMALPGGDDAPSGDGWCLDINPGETSLVRMHEGVEPLASLYLPEFKMEAGIQDNGECEKWMEANLVTEVQIVVSEGSKLGFELKIDDGALLYYGSDDYLDGDVSEEEVIEALGNYLETMLGLIGGVAEIDLAEFLGGAGDSQLPLEGLSISIHDSTKMLDSSGEELPGLYALSIDLWNPVMESSEDLED